MGILSFFLIIATVLFSWQGFRNKAFYEKYIFSVEKVLVEKQYYRLLSSALLHTGWMHLLFNMFSLYAFSEAVELYLGPLQYLLIYFSGAVAGNLLSLLIHKHHYYRSAGASGAVCAVIFAAIAIFPGMSIGIFPFPFSIPAWVYGLLFVGISIFALRARFDDIGHDAHLGGALAGMLLAIAMQPSSLQNNLLPILVVTIPSLILIYLLAKKPHLFLGSRNVFDTPKEKLTIDQRYNATKAEMQKEVDRILDKISRRGYSSLTANEKSRLEAYSKEVK